MLLLLACSLQTDVAGGVCGLKVEKRPACLNDIAIID